MKTFNHHHPQNFGIVSTRFKGNKHHGTNLGPGQYLSMDHKISQCEKYIPKNVVSFKSTERSDLIVNYNMVDTPSPYDYIPDQTKDLNTNRQPGDKKPFGVN